jgi:hypothetical protein
MMSLQEMSPTYKDFVMSHRWEKLVTKFHPHNLAEEMKVGEFNDGGVSNDLFINNIGKIIKKKGKIL